MPLYTPEPDVIYEAIRSRHQLAGTGLRWRTAWWAWPWPEPEASNFRFLFARVWYTMEFGSSGEAGQLKVFGAGSSCPSVGETSTFRRTPASVHLLAMGGCSTTSPGSTRALRVVVGGGA